MKRMLFVALGMGLGLSLVNSRAEFTGYYAIPNPAPGVGASVSAPLSGTPVGLLGNWTASGVTVPGNFSRSPDTLIPQPATAFTLTADVNGQAKFEITQPTQAQYDSFPFDSYPKYYFSWNLNLQGTDTAWFVDAAGTHNLPSPVGTDFFINTPGNSGANWGFYIDASNNGGSKSEALQIQGWIGVPEPSSIAMGLITCLGVAGFAVRRFQCRKS